MKKIWSFLLVLALSVAVITGCSKKPNQPTTQQPQAQTEQQTQQNEQSVVSSGESVQQAPAPAQNVPDASNFIGEEKAKEIALQRAGISAEGVIFDRVELDRDNGVWQYELDFRQGRTEYDADIKADDGSIISFEMDYDD